MARPLRKHQSQSSFQLTNERLELHQKQLRKAASSRNLGEKQQQQQQQQQQPQSRAPKRVPTIEAQLRAGPPAGNVEKGLREMKKLILKGGIIQDSNGIVRTFVANSTHPASLDLYAQLADRSITQSSNRIYVWSALFGVPNVSTREFQELVARGHSPAFIKIKNDVFRTLTTDPLFRHRVTENSMNRLLNTIAWKLHDAKQAPQKPHNTSISSLPDSVRSGPIRTIGPAGGGSGISRMTSIPSLTAGAQSTPQLHKVAGRSTPAAGRKSTSSITSDIKRTANSPFYLQGMNVLAAPFLYVTRSEPEAFAMFDALIHHHCPKYFLPSMDGVHAGMALVDKVLSVIDPRLHGYLTGKGITATVYAFPSVASLSACTPPLPEVLLLWDFLFSFGTHLNLLCVVAQVTMIRDSLLDSDR